MTKQKDVDEITFSQVISDLGYEDDFFLRMKCYEKGAEIKLSNGQTTNRKGKYSVYSYKKEDYDIMKQIVQSLFASSDSGYNTS